MTRTTGPAQAILLIGPTGAGKTPLGRMLEERGFRGRRCRHFDFGDELRAVAAASPPLRGLTCREHAFVRGLLEEGLLLEDEHFPIARKIFANFFERVGFGAGDLLVLNGFPRHAGQAEAVKTVADVEGVVILDCSTDDVMARIASNVGGDRADRLDDERAMISRKLTLFRERTEPLIDLYGRMSARIVRVRVTAEMTTDDAYDRLTCLAWSCFDA